VDLEAALAVEPWQNSQVRQLCGSPLLAAGLFAHRTAGLPDDRLAELVEDGRLEEVSVWHVLRPAVGSG
jgi:hypothetical protein